MAKVKCWPELPYHLGHGSICQAHSGCWQSLVPNNTGNEVPFFFGCQLGASWRPSTIHCHMSLSKTWQLPCPWSLDPDLSGLCDEVGAAQTMSLTNPKSTPRILIIPLKVLLPHSIILGVILGDFTSFTQNPFSQNGWRVLIVYYILYIVMFYIFMIMFIYYNVILILFLLIYIIFC